MQCKEILISDRLVGSFPFKGKTRKEIFMSNKLGKIECESVDWSLITKKAKNLVLGMLETIPELRLTADQSLNHSWFALNCFMPKILSLSIETPRKNLKKENEKVKSDIELISVPPVLHMSDSALLIKPAASKNPAHTFNQSSLHGSFKLIVIVA